jgi:ribosome-associated translation inhibitor RaiA
METDKVTKTLATSQAALSRSSSLVSAHLRVVGVELGEDQRSRLRRKLATKLGKFAASIERVSVCVADANGPRGGVDQVCRINVVLIGLPPVVVEERDASLESAIDGALTGAERAVRRSVQRRRMKPIRGRHNRRSHDSGVLRTAK